MVGRKSKVRILRFAGSRGKALLSFKNGGGYHTVGGGER